MYNTDKIFKGIEQLPDGYRIILTLYLLEGYDHTEISQIMGISESTSKSQYSRAKEKLRTILLKK
jgi:RNA polymerase sigma factor (sigma-70 family)